MFTSYLVTKIFLIFLLMRAVIQAYLELRNRKNIINHFHQVPSKFSDQISLADHQKAANYTLEKMKIGKFFRFLDIILLLLWTLGGGLELLDGLVKKFSNSEIYNGVLFIAIFSLASTLLHLPQSYYFTFVLEEKFGFNKTNRRTFILDIIKSLTVGSIIGLPIVALLIYFMKSLGPNWWAYAWAATTLFQFFLMWLYPTLIAPIFNKFTPLEEGKIKKTLEDLLKETDFKNNGLFVMDASRRSSHGNAYFTGLGKSKRIVLFDTILKGLTEYEVKAILAHELGHFKKKHILKGLIRAIVMGIIGFYILGLCYKSTAFFQGHGISTPSTYAALLLFALVGSVYTFLLTPIESFLSRKYEFEADQFASVYAPSQDLINALIKLYKDNASTLTPDPIFSAFYHSHPPASTRVQFLEGLTNNNET